MSMGTPEMLHDEPRVRQSGERTRSPHRLPPSAIAVAGAFLLWLPGIGLRTAEARPPLTQEPKVTEGAQEVTDIDLEDLMKVRVTSASKKEQVLTEVPAAVYVIRSEDLRRSGVTSIPEALRRVPGVHVGRQDANSWSVTARGFSSANKLLVLIDGRTVYSPLQSGVFWDVQNVFLEDVDRIEVIRGPGGSIWGSNAVNGVINVITKSARDTQGGVVTAGAGFEERNFAGGRYGFKVGDDHHVRISSNTFDRDDSVQAADPSERLFDDLFIARADFRWDWKAGANDRLTLLGGAYHGEAQERVTGLPLLTPPFITPAFRQRTDLAGGHVLWRWDREFSPTSNMALQLYYDHTLRSNDIFEETVQTGDLDLQHRFSPLAGHDVVWGLGYRVYESDFEGTFVISLHPEERVDDLPSAFVQDEIVIVEDRLRLTLGSKFEHNDYSGFEVQPSVRLGWTPDPAHMAWLSASRAVRTPSIIDHDLRINFATLPGAPPTVLAFLGDKDFKSEELIAFEAGYRMRPWDALQVDMALFYNIYDNLRSTEPGATFSESDPPPAHDVSPSILKNEIEARTYGAEVAVNLQAASWWLLQGSYTYLYMNLDPKDSSLDTTSEAEERRSPRNQVWLRSAMDLPGNVTLDVMTRYVSRLPPFPADAYVEADVRLAWRDPDLGLEVALVGQNLIHEHHEEMSSDRTGSELERGGYLSVTWRF